MTNYSHGCDLAFEVVSQHKDGEDITPAMFRLAIIKRINDIDRTDSWDQTINIFDTYNTDTDI